MMTPTRHALPFTLVGRDHSNKKKNSKNMLRYPGVVLSHQKKKKKENQKENFNISWIRNLTPKKKKKKEKARKPEKAVRIHDMLPTLINLLSLSPPPLSSSSSSSSSPSSSFSTSQTNLTWETFPKPATTLVSE